MVGWHLHKWVTDAGRVRGWVEVARLIKAICHIVRFHSLGSIGTEPAIPRGIPKRVVQGLIDLAKMDSANGLAFSRCSRALPSAPYQVQREALLKHLKIVTTRVDPSPHWALDGIKEYVRYNVRLKLREVRLPSSRSGCLQMPASKGGIDCYFRKMGEYLIGRCRLGRKDPAEIVGRMAQDSLGQYCLRLCRSVLAGELDTRFPDGEEAVRAAGVLLARGFRGVGGLDLGVERAIFEDREQQTPGPRYLQLKPVPVAAPGMKARIVGVPDALTYIEGDWIRTRHELMPESHWTIPPFPNDKLPRVMTGKKKFVSVDLTSATDGLRLDAIGAVVEGWYEAGAISSSERALARTTLGLEPHAIWHTERGARRMERGSPMGTPLSFPVLSWVNAWASQAFDSYVTHGDDGVGVVTHDFQLDEYETAITAVGGEVNRTKTFIGPNWTACEIFGRLGQYGTRVSGMHRPPPIPSSEIKAPIVAPPCDGIYLRRLERVMRTRFPWASRDPRMRLPAAVGGLGYTGRGLSVGVKLRKKLAAACSRVSTLEDFETLCGGRAFRDRGFYPRPFLPRPTDRRGFYLAQKWAEEKLPIGEGKKVLAKDLVEARCVYAESHYTYWQPLDLVVKKDGGRSQKRKTSALFKTSFKGDIAPLTVSHGLYALERLVERVKNLEVSVPEEVAQAIRGRTTCPTY